VCIFFALLGVCASLKVRAFSVLYIHNDAFSL
jgi:hypothetical protein